MQSQELTPEKKGEGTDKQFRGTNYSRLQIERTTVTAGYEVFPVEGMMVLCQPFQHKDALQIKVTKDAGSTPAG